MKFSTDKSHRDYFYKHGVIEFDELFNADQVHEMDVLIGQILCKRLSIQPNKLARLSPEEFFLHGYNLFRDDESLKKLLLHRRLAEIAAELLEVQYLRMGFDQLFVGETEPSKFKTIYDQFLHQEGTLQEKSCIKPVVCGLNICIEPAQPSEMTSILFPKTPGSGVFFKADIPLDFQFLTQVSGGRYLMIAYADRRTVYILNEKDPHTHLLKRQGYVFGDLLSDSLNPLICRK